MSSGLTKKELKEDFAKYLTGKTSYPGSLDNTDFETYAKKALGRSSFNTYECYQIDDLYILYLGLCQPVTTEAQDALKHGTEACRPALRDYVQYLRSKGYAENDNGQKFDKLKNTMSSSIMKLAKKKSAQPIENYTFSFLIELVKLIGKNNFAKYVVEHSLFFSNKTVDVAHEIMKERIKLAEDERIPFPVRKSETNSLYKCDTAGKPMKYGENIYEYNDNIFGWEGMRLSIDKDGNDQLRQLINCLTHAKPSQGKDNSNIDFGKISHVWGQAFRPYLFTALWNVAIVPAFLNDILDKHDDNAALMGKVSSDESMFQNIVKDVQDLFRCVCWVKYDVDNKLRELGVGKEEIKEMRPDKLDEFDLEQYDIKEIGYNFNSRCNINVKPTDVNPEIEILGQRLIFPIKNKEMLKIFSSKK